MSTRAREALTTRHALTPAFVILLAVSIGGCVIVPYKPKAEVAVRTDVQVDARNFLVTEGPREQLEKFAAALADEDDGITIIPGREFLEVAVQDEDASLAHLLEPANCTRTREALGADFLVLVAEVEEYTTDEAGGIVPYIGFYGAMKQKDHTVAAATVIDLERAQPLCDVNSHAQGTTAGVGVFYGLFVTPMTGSSARDGLAQGVMAAMRERAGSRPLKVAVLAAEKVGGIEQSAPAAVEGESGQQ